MLTLIDNFGDHITLNIYCFAAIDNNRIEFRLNSFVIVVVLKRTGLWKSLFTCLKARCKPLPPVLEWMDLPERLADMESAPAFSLSCAVLDVSSEVVATDQTTVG